MVLFSVIYLLVIEVCYVHDGLQAQATRSYNDFVQCVVRQYGEIPYRNSYPKC